MGLNRNNLTETLLVDSSQVGVSEFMIHYDTNQQTEVRIIDTSKRASDTSFESTRALELVLNKDQKRCKHICPRMRSVFYSVWIMMFKQHGMPPVTGVNLWLMGFSMTLSLELLITAVFLLHLTGPASNVWTFGFPFLFVLPGLTLIAPVWGLVATMMGSAPMLKSYSTINETMLLTNYPLTLVALWFFSDQEIYSVYMYMLILNKVCLSLFGSKVRQHFVNPAFAKTQAKLK